MQVFALALLACFVASAALAAQSQIAVSEDDQVIRVETDALQAVIRKKGYVTGIAAGSFVDKRTGAKDIGFGLHIMDFLLAPGWADDGYEREPKIHGKLPKHYIEGPQICTQAKEVQSEIVRGDNFVAIRLRFAYTQPAPGFKAGSTWKQTLVFQPALRYVLSAERLTSANDVDDLFYRLDMPGHIRHRGGDNFAQIYLSYLPEPIPASEFIQDFGPDEKFLYQRQDGKVPQRMIRAYQVKLDGKPGPWLAGMTLEPSGVAEAWCHQRGYVCMIEELHRRHVRAGEEFGNAYIIGWFDDIPQMQQVYDRHRGATGITIQPGQFRLESSGKNTDWLKDARYGVFMHFLPADSKSLALVNDFDVEALAGQLESLGAKYFVITLGQNSGFFNSPNAAYDKHTGYAPGERCAKRDLPLDLYKALQPKGIKLMLYLPCQVPNQDARAQKAFGLPQGAKDQPIDLEFAGKWAQVIQEWADRYGDKVAGWWFDGAYAHVKFNPAIAQVYAAAAKHGNPRAILTFNPGVKVIHYTDVEDYTAGELNEPFRVVPSSRWLAGSQWHALTFLGSSWSHRNTRYPAAQWAQWVKAVVAKEGAVTLDMGPNWDAKAGAIGSLSEEQMKQVLAIKAGLEKP